MCHAHSLSILQFTKIYEFIFNFICGPSKFHSKEGNFFKYMSRILARLSILARKNLFSHKILCIMKYNLHQISKFELYNFSIYKVSSRF